MEVVFFDDSSTKLGGFDENKERLSKIHHLVIAACGTSLFSGLYAMNIMKYLKSFETIQVIDAAEITVSDFPHKNGGLLVISQSGETKDVHRAVEVAMELGIPCISIVNVVGSLIARTTNCGVYLNAGREHAVASTKAFTCQVTVLSLVAIWFAQTKSISTELRKIIVENLHRLPTSVGMTVHSVLDKCKDIAMKLKDAHTLFVLGKGYGLPIAHEGSLKIKEIGYIHSEAYSGGALKHGPYALIEKDTPVICIMLDDMHFSKMKIVVEEVKARGARVFVITNIKKFSEIDPENTILVPSNGVFTAMLSVIPLQVIAYEISVARGIDPDHPRNLAKSITVD